VTAVAPWYLRYFTPDYWQFTRYEYTAERTAAEVEYLAATLAELAPGPRVLDLGCGTGRHAVALARRGFTVTGVDASAAALSLAATAATAAGVDLALHQVDLLAERSWPMSTVDAVVFVQGLGWGGDAEHVQLLRRVRRLLPPGGVLVADHSNVSAILANFQAEAVFSADGVTYEMNRRYDPVSGRNLGEMRVRYPDGRLAVLPHDVRLYQPPEVRRMLVAAGFRVLRVDADFTAGAPVRPDTRYVQFVAGADGAAGAGAGGAGGRSGSAVESHRAPVPAGHLDLRWAPDEVEFVRADVDAAWATVEATADRARAYPLADPYGSDRLAPVLAAHFGCPVEPRRVVAGAGATGLLHALAALAGEGPVLATPLGHPDLPARARALGAAVLAPAADPAGLVAGIRTARPALVLLDRPGVTGEIWPLPAVRALAEAAAAAGALLVLDETCAAYAGPAASAVPLTAEVGSLVVVRSLSKGYCCGGLRAGYAVCSAPVADEVRAAALPLAVSELSLAAAVALLRRGDVFGPLRDRVAAVKPATLELLAAAGFGVSAGDPRLPWLLVRAAAPIAAAAPATGATAPAGPTGPGAGSASERAAAATVAALAGRHLTGRSLSRVDGRATGWVRLSVPLTADRVAAVRAALAAELGARR
jgi:histidinol-phosphate/aromatic aminotransferase/cobyric acid decarboxylase-like protein/ubiquinone/menaquinone biosynthesis C-methylase UbiE